MSEEAHIKTSNQIAQDEHDLSTAPFTKRVLLYGWDSTNLQKTRISVNSDGELQTGSGANYAVKIDEAVSGTTYIGKAVIGSSTASGVWRIKRMVQASSVTTITWADGNDSFDNIWDDRASLSYS